MILHTLFNRHKPDLTASGWQGASFVTVCEICGEQMVKPVGKGWRIAEKR
jgi:hypothetical protein